MFENRKKSLIQHCERSELRVQKFIKNAKNSFRKTEVCSQIVLPETGQNWLKMPKCDILSNFQTMWIRLGTILVIDAVHVFKAVSRGVLAFKAKKSVFCTGYWSMTDDDIKRTRNTEAEYMSADFLTYSISIQFFVQSTYPTSCLLLGTVSVCMVHTHTSAYGLFSSTLSCAFSRPKSSGYEDETSEAAANNARVLKTL